MTNVFAQIAKSKKRDYITPEDVSKALDKRPISLVRRDLLEVLAKQLPIGVEDHSLCAYIAWKGKQ